MSPSAAYPPENCCGFHPAILRRIFGSAPAHDGTTGHNPSCDCPKVAASALCLGEQIRIMLLNLVKCFFEIIYARKVKPQP
ncbi:MAG: hypothetical protein KatS3mg130_1653 [Candidatus Sumerlaea sp.]|nr:MAG: hypothetical protein KatS3mg130_1653 [Candidatus Sumerlaea sp.]